MSISVSERILKGSRDIWDGFYSHPFVTGIADGTLPVEKFQYFMIQDYLYLYEYTRVFLIGAAKAKDPEVMRFFSEYAAHVQSSEMEIHRSYMKRLGISTADAEKARMSQENLSYTSYMIRTAYESGPAHVCAAVLPCAVSYEMIARRMIVENPTCVNDPFFGEWIDGYACDEYHEENEQLKAVTDRAAEHFSDEEVDSLVETGRRCSLYEGGFWDMAWNMQE